MPVPIVMPDPEGSPVSCLFHFKCAACHGIVGTDYPREEVTCVCGGALEEIAGQVVEKKGTKCV